MNRPDIDTLEGNAYQSTIYVYSQLQDEYIDKLEKALGKACANLHGTNGLSAKQWEEYLLNDGK